MYLKTHGMNNNRFLHVIFSVNFPDEYEGLRDFPTTSQISMKNPNDEAACIPMPRLSNDVLSRVGGSGSEVPCIDALSARLL